MIQGILLREEIGAVIQSLLLQAEIGVIVAL